MDNAEWNNDWNQRRYNRGITVPGFTNRPHVIGRRQISFLAASNMIPHPLSWPSYYVDYVNDAVTAGHDANRLPAILKGVFRCSAIRVYTRNQNVSYIVEAEFVRDPLGHDPMALFVDSQTGLVPADVVVDAGMKTAWPTVRATAATPYGAARPQMVRGSRNFNDERLRIDLRPFNVT